MEFSKYLCIVIVCHTAYITKDMTGEREKKIKNCFFLVFFRKFLSMLLNKIRDESFYFLSTRKFEVFFFFLSFFRASLFVCLPYCFTVLISYDSNFCCCCCLCASFCGYKIIIIYIETYPSKSNGYSFQMMDIPFIRFKQYVQILYGKDYILFIIIYVHVLDNYSFDLVCDKTNEYTGYIIQNERTKLRIVFFRFSFSFFFSLNKSLLSLIFYGCRLPHYKK